MSENDRRLARAAQTMHAYRVLIYGRSGYAAEPLGQSVRDLLADLMHWCDVNEIDLAYELEVARDHYAIERTGEEN